MYKLFSMCRRSDSFFLIVVLKFFYYRLFGKTIFAHQNVKIRGLKNINTEGRLFIGIANNDFTMPHDSTYLHVKGRLDIVKDFHIGRGCRFAIGQNAYVVFGRSMVNADSLFIINHKLTVGDGCVISWNCQFLDDDFHQITYAGKVEKDPGISIGNNVWIGSNVYIYKGVSLAEGIVVAGNSVVVSSFDEPNCLIGGNPAKVLKRNVSWQQ